MLYKYRISILIILIAAIVLFVAVGVYVYVSRPKPTEVTKITSVKSSSLTIDFSGINPQDANKFKPGVDSSFIQYLSATSVDLNQVRTATARANSVTILASLDAPLTSVLVDTLPLNTTYTVLLEGGVGYDRSIIYVSCAPKDQQLDPEARCVDATS